MSSAIKASFSGILGVHSVANVINVGETVSDIKDGISVGVVTVGVIEGISGNHPVLETYISGSIMWTQL